MEKCFRRNCNDAAGRECTTAANLLLPAREFDLLHVLMLHAGRVLSREQLEQQL